MPHFRVVLIPYIKIIKPASVAQLDALSDSRPGGRGFNPRRGRQHSFVEIDHEIFTMVILSLPLIQEGQLSVSGERMCTILVNRLEDYACPINVWLGKLTALDMTPLGCLGRKTSTQTNIKIIKPFLDNKMSILRNMAPLKYEIYPFVYINARIQEQ